MRAWTRACRVRLRRTNRRNEEPEGSKEKPFMLFSSTFFSELSLTSLEQSEAHLFSSVSNSDLERLSSRGHSAVFVRVACLELSQASV